MQVETKLWTPNQITALLQKNDRAVARVIVVLYQLQTADEQAGDSTRWANGKGFNAADASAGSYFARYVLAGRNLTGQCLERARQIANRYRGQLACIANSKQN
mgnify:CR=1 FL=1